VGQLKVEIEKVGGVSIVQCQIEESLQCQPYGLWRVPAVPIAFHLKELELRTTVIHPRSENAPTVAAICRGSARVRDVSEAQR
jgi:hypothetical protein